MALITLAVAKQQLRITTANTSPLSDEDLLIERKTEQASDIILNYLKIPVTSPPLYDETTAPARIQSAVMLMLGHLWEHRGDDVAITNRAPDVAIWEAITLLLARDRDPALA